MYKIGILAAAVLFVMLAIYMAVVSSSNINHDNMSNEHSIQVAAITSEQAFLEHMIPHHAEAVAAAELVLQKGTSFRPLTELAEDIVAGQTIEIAQMKDWYQAWYSVPYEEVGTYTPMMRPLEELSGVELDRAFLEDMILHHEAAIATAKAVLKLSITDETKELANGIIAAQEREIALMQELLGLLPK
ncbi:hypothetical protein A3I99_02620 [Candidatus Kaiserbacteria bacterium RIFCSPLOWO2_02_FULL_45_11b]|uniref:DUF305 domain-containing protein n=1 Tax=Candidatus Kaiserbacteria bacterium RIFCSPLOWO2_12_FULL_45_26 TaxID=1798525 RepID=A0A1F6FFB8_9BACT|nr:MAG: hypothetical protein A2Z56_01810 [Candidatus Kaiserbacteria bacterium RIFCSPHIGHO2_12_45_16]OGG70279.1 MAG: hypothetical protein A2929_04365 [Candidatus Kaiserbacteria bacterium RIFCSPLOWO2_01_FULL_45_25]OGG81947.1 MAG: hypothetical protein A3I99_02620 [Candidatus Kaiserbacteria bacterium RIFCSPLOWO2_02_FULL_45_11b]OGG84543.1 MAG: hypothetical protein A3G90_00410 [Candidatus Kaiserbacteria bacterium RIFCSPLOWO2_12_FULL_45_26]